MFNYYGLSMTLTVTGFASLVGGAISDVMGKESASLSVLSGMTSLILTCGVNVGGKNATYEEINGYIQSLSTEELRNLSEDLAAIADLGDSEDSEFVNRINSISENADIFDSLEEKNLIQENVAEYLSEEGFKHSDIYEATLDALDDGVYEDGEISKQIFVKKMGL